MLQEDDPIVNFKLSMLDRGLPARSAVVFGDVWRVDGGYTVACAERGCERVLLWTASRRRPGRRSACATRRSTS